MLELKPGNLIPSIPKVNKFFVVYFGDLVNSLF